MEIPSKLKNFAAVTAAGIAVVGFEMNSGAEPSKVLGLVGKQAIANCVTHQSTEVTPVDLKTDIDTSEIDDALESSPIRDGRTRSVLKIEVKPEGVCYREQFSSKKEPQFLKRLLATVLDNKEYIDVAAKDGNLDLIDFTLPRNAAQSNGFYEEDVPDSEDYSKSIKPDDVATVALRWLNNNSPLVISSTLRHEVMHAVTAENGLSSGSASSKVGDFKYDKEFTDACMQLQDMALKDQAENYTDAYNDFSDAYDDIKNDYTNYDAFEILHEISDSIDNGTYAELLKKYNDKSKNFININSKYGINLPECLEPVNPWTLASKMMKAKGIDEEYIYDFIYYSDMPKLMKKLEDTWYGMYSNPKIYGILQESSYLKETIDNSRNKFSSSISLDYFEKSNIVNDIEGRGHVYDNWDELMASTLNILISYPEQLRDKYDDLPEKQQKLIKKIIELVSQTTIETHPEDTKLINQLKTNLSYFKD